MTHIWQSFFSKKLQIRVLVAAAEPCYKIKFSIELIDPQCKVHMTDAFFHCLSSYLTLMSKNDTNNKTNNER